METFITISFSYRSQKPAASVHIKLASATSLDGYSAHFNDKDAFCVKSISECKVRLCWSSRRYNKLTLSFFAASHKTESSRSELRNVRNVKRNVFPKDVLLQRCKSV